jgi:CrcB protein
MVWVGVLIAGAIGAICRWLTGRLISGLPHPGWAMWGTTTANILGCGLLGLVDRLAATHALDLLWATILGIGFVGAYTTYSTWMFELAELLRAGATLRLLQVLMVNLGLGLVLYSSVRFL